MQNLPALSEKLNNPNKPTKLFVRDYNILFQDDPLQANALLLLYEIADKTGTITITDDEYVLLFNMRFKNPSEYQIEGF